MMGELWGSPITAYLAQLRALRLLRSKVSEVLRYEVRCCTVCRYVALTKQPRGRTGNLKRCERRLANADLCIRASQIYKL